jgi:hypothetical protein
MQIRSAVLFAYWLIFQLCWFLLVAMRSTLAINIALLGTFLLILYPILRKGGDKQMDKWFWFVRGLLLQLPVLRRQNRSLDRQLNPVLTPKPESDGQT